VDALNEHVVYCLRTKTLFFCDPGKTLRTTPFDKEEENCHFIRKNQAKPDQGLFGHFTSDQMIDQPPCLD
jgi:hypothetical protein